MPKAARRVHCGCTILPPYLLRRIAAHGTQAQREAALDTLATDQSCGSRARRTNCWNPVRIATC